MNSDIKKSLFLLCSFLSALLISFIPFDETVNGDIYDALFKARYRLKGRERISNEICIFHLDSIDMEELNINTSDRSIYTKILENLIPAGTSVVVMDIIFRDKISADKDSALINITKELGNVLYPLVLINKAPVDNEGSGKDYIKQSVIFPRIKKAGNPLREEGIITVFPDLAAVSAGLGAINRQSEPGNAVRRIPLLYCINHGYVPSLPLSAVCSYFNVDPDQLEVQFGEYIKIPGAANPHTGRKRDIKIPIDASGRMAINYTGPWGKAVKRYSFRAFFNAMKNPEAYQEVLNSLEGNIVIVSDISINSNYSAGIFDKQIPQSDIIFNTINTIVTENFLFIPKRTENILSALLIPIVFWLLALKRKRRFFIIGSLGLFLSIILLNGLLFILKGWVGNIYLYSITFLVTGCAAFLCIPLKTAVSAGTRNYNINKGLNTRFSHPVTPKAVHTGSLRGESEIIVIISQEELLSGYIGEYIKEDSRIISIGSIERFLDELPFISSPTMIITDEKVRTTSAVRLFRELKTNRKIRKAYLIWTGDKITPGDKQYLLSSGVADIVNLKSGKAELLYKIKRLLEIKREQTEEVLRGMAYHLSQAITLPSPVPESFAGMLPEEKDIVIQLIKGSNYQEISKNLSLSINTVKKRIQKIYRKYDVGSKVELLNKLKSYPDG